MLRDEVILNDETYLKLDEDIYSLLHRIETFLPKDKKYLLETLESIYNRQESIAEKLSYEQGFKDGSISN